MEINGDKVREVLKKIWRFIWYEDSFWSWVVNIILAFLIIKFLVYPALGFLLNTPFPIVAVVSGSMEHSTDFKGTICGVRADKINNFDEYWKNCGKWYEDHGIYKKEFMSYPYREGFNKGDIMILHGPKPSEIKRGDILVFNGQYATPIIHRIVEVKEGEGKYKFTTKGDHNAHPFPNENEITEDKIYGTALFRIPYLGWIKIIFAQHILGQDIGD